MNNKNIILIVDVKGWAFDNIAHYIKDLLSGEYNVIILYIEDIGAPSSFIRNLEKYESILLIHFFSRKYLKALLQYVAFKNLNIPPVSTCIPDHLFIEKDRDIKSYAPVLRFVDNYYCISKKLYDLYANIEFYPPPHLDVIYDNVLIPKLAPGYSDREIIRLCWIGNSAFGGISLDKDIKGFFSVIKPLEKILNEDNIKFNFKIADKAKKQFNREEVFQILADSDILLIASSSEGTPLPLIEAMASGVVIISTDVGTAREVLPLKQHEFIIKQDPEDFASAVKNLNSDRKLLRELKELNYKSYCDIFLNREDFKSKWVKFIEETLKHIVDEHSDMLKKQALIEIKSEGTKIFQFMQIIYNIIIYNRIFRKILKFLIRSRALL